MNEYDSTDLIMRLNLNFNRIIYRNNRTDNTLFLKTFECTKKSLCRINSFQRELFSKPSKDSLLSFSRKNQILFVIFLIWLTFGLNLAIFSFVFSSDFDHTLFQSLNLSFWRAASWELSVYYRQVTAKELINDEPVISELVCNRILFEAPSLATSIPHFEPIQKLSFPKKNRFEKLVIFERVPFIF